MTTYRLLPRQGSETFQRIICKRKWVGRVTQHTDGYWLGVIGKKMVKATTSEGAFREIAARALGFKDAATLHVHNQRVRESNRVVRRRRRHVLDEIMRGNFKPLDELFGGPDGKNT